YVADVALSDADWEDMVTLGEALYQGKGAQFILEVTKSTSNSGRVYTNYDFRKYDEDVNEGDLPF
ncbi:hypothetical protein QP145_15605, partial [Enterococcus faecalis]|nr:hypothetical protein [Enterococcus faecalis]